MSELSDELLAAKENFHKIDSSCCGSRRLTRQTFALGSLCTLLLDYIEEALTTLEGGLPIAYISFRKLNDDTFDNIYFRQQFALFDEELSAKLMSEIFTQETVLRIRKAAAPYPVNSRLLAGLPGDTLLQSTKDLSFLAVMLTRSVQELFDDYSDDDVLAVYDVCDRQYLESYFEDDTAAFTDWIRAYPLRDRKKQNEAYKDRLLKALGLTTLLKKAMERMDAAHDSEDPLEKARAAMRYLSDSNGQPERDTVGRLLLEMRCKLSDEAIRDYFRYIHMCAHIDGKPLPAPTTVIKADKVEVGNVDQLNVGCENVSYH